MITLDEIKQDKSINQMIKRTEQFLDAQGYTDHGKRHLNIVSTRAGKLARKLELGNDIEEYAMIAGWTHDTANFISRTNHHYFGALLFFDLFMNHDDQKGVMLIMEAISNHDKAEAQIANPITALLIIADKSDVHRSRVKTKDMEAINNDIHDRVNYSVIKSDLKVRNGDEKKIVLDLKLDNDFTTVMDYFEIFLGRMKYCKEASEYLGYDFDLIIDGTKVG